MKTNQVTARELKNQLTATKQDVMDRLPSKCFVVKPDDETVVIVKRGVMGYFQTPSLPPMSDVRAFVRELNAEDGVTKFQEEAMLNGSMFGFHVPGADPAYLESHQPKKAVRS